MNELDQLYQQIILEHAKARHGEGTLSNPDGESHQVNPTCGDEVTLQVNVTIDEEAQTISELAWNGQGCSISQASISVMNDLVVGKDVEEFNRLLGLFQEQMESRGAGLPDEKADQLEDASAFAGVSRFPARIKCALLGWMALRDAAAKASVKKGSHDG